MLEDLRRDRLEKRKKIQDTGEDPYPADVTRTVLVGNALKNFGAWSHSRKRIFVSGRIWSLRDQGGVIFAHVRDETGIMQVVLKKDILKHFDFLKSVLDRGDIVSVGGVLFTTTRGEKSIEADNIRIVTKSLRPLPTEWYGIQDIETRLRDRYLDLLFSEDTRDLFRKKAVFWNAFRDYLRREGFLEVETPTMEATPGGAEAEPFKTHMNALDVDFYLRISLEIALKKLLVGGYEKVFEIGRIFRNEGIDREHLQDYTQLEFYWAYRDYEDLMAYVEKLYKFVIKETTGVLATAYGEKEIAWAKKWQKVHYVEIFRDAVKIDPRDASRDKLMDIAVKLKLAPETYAGKGRLLDLIFKKTVRPTLIQPVFLVNPPVELEPLAKRTREDPRLVERFQIMAAGTELGKGFSELNDPVDQRLRFEEQMTLRARGDHEAQRLDEEFLKALEYGMPPACGFGVSERLFAVLMDKPVRETVLFPLMRLKDE